MRSICHRQSNKNEILTVASTELIHSDICGSITPSIDDFSQSVKPKLLSNKNENRKQFDKLCTRSSDTMQY